MFTSDEIVRMNGDLSIAETYMDSIANELRLSPYVSASCVSASYVSEDYLREKATVVKNCMEFILTCCSIAERREKRMIDLTERLKDDVEITLLSTEEYESMKAHIPHLNYWWWLRSPGYDQSRATYVNGDGSDYCVGGGVFVDCGGVRPALKSKILNPVAIGTAFSAFGNRWTVCGKGIAISNGVIDFRQFDDGSNEYEYSEIKKYLEEWLQK